MEKGPTLKADSKKSRTIGQNIEEMFTPPGKLHQQKEGKHCPRYSCISQSNKTFNFHVSDVLNYSRPKKY